jgi:myo-inositol 2-dehydrogenase/D-chiro-inositol 1-dehydrogenase
MSDLVRFGLIGYGLFGKHHARAIADCPGTTLVAVAVKSDASRADAQCAHSDADVYADYRELIARDDIDVVSVVVPNRLHHEVGLAVLRAGKHLLMEKPMAIRLTDCDELLRVAAEGNRIVAIGHELRLSSLWGGVKRLIDEGRIGHPQHALIELSRFPYREGSEGWRYDIDRVGNWILEEPIHFFDLVHWYLEACGDPISVYARATSRHAEHPELTDNFSAIVNFNDGGYAVVSQTLAAFGHHVMGKVVGTKGCIWATWGAADARDEAPTFSLRYGLGDDVYDVSFESVTGELVELEQEIAAVARAVRGGGLPPCTGADGRWSTLLCLAASHSVESGLPTLIEEFITEAETAGNSPP